MAIVKEKQNVKIIYNKHLIVFRLFSLGNALQFKMLLQSGWTLECLFWSAFENLLKTMFTRMPIDLSSSRLLEFENMFQ